MVEAPVALRSLKLKGRTVRETRRAVSRFTGREGTLCSLSRSLCAAICAFTRRFGSGGEGGSQHSTRASPAPLKIPKGRHAPVPAFRYLRRAVFVLGASGKHYRELVFDLKKTPIAP